jgi:hypothetical protein
MSTTAADEKRREQDYEEPGSVWLSAKEAELARALLETVADSVIEEMGLHPLIDKLWRERGPEMIRLRPPKDPKIQQTMAKLRGDE